MPKPFTIKEFPQAFFSGKRDELSKRLTNNCNTKLQSKFFSDDNIKTINILLINNVYLKSNKKIKILPQNKNDLIVIMAAIFKSKARHLNTNIDKQIKELNCRVVTKILPDVLSNAKSYKKYIDDINKPLNPVANPISTNRDKSLPSISSIFHK